MRLELEQGLGASRHALHGTWSGGGKAGTARRGGGQQASVTRTLARLSWMTGSCEHGGSAPLEVSWLEALAGAKRHQQAALSVAEVTAGLRETVTGVTCLASFRPAAPRLTVASTVLARAPEPGAEKKISRVWEQDEGGIYSW